MRYSLYVCIVTGIIYFISFHFYRNWQNGLSDGDPTGYYVWLPSTFIYHDVSNPQKTIAVRQKTFSQPERSTREEGFQHPEGASEEVYLNKYTMGMAILYAPFFALAHLLAPLLGYEQDGYSLIYRYLVFFNAVIYGFLGLLVLRRVLLRYFSDTVTAWTLGAVGLATNLYFFASWNTGMSHAGSFFLFALLLLFTEKWYENQRFVYACALGAVYGLIALIRPSDAISIGVPVFWGITSWKSVRDRAYLLSRYWQHFIAAVLCAMAVGLPQLLFWKKYAGTFFYYSYGEERFDFSNPHLLEGIFGYQNGWLAYTPLMYLAIVGILWLWKTRNNYLLPVLLLLPLQLYIIYSWWCWQYINGYGARPMIQFYALLAIPLGGTLAYAFGKKWLRWPVAGFVLLCGALNIFQEWQFNHGLLWPELGNRRFFFSTIGKTRLTQNDMLYFDAAPQQPADTSKLRLVKMLYFNDFEDSTSAHFVRGSRHSGQFSFRFNRSREFSPGLAVEPVGPDVKPGRWLKMSIWCMRQHSSIDLYKMSTLVTYIGQKGEMVAYHAIRLDNKPGNDGNLWSGTQHVWAQVAYFVPVPKEIREDDLLKVYVWNPTEFDIFVDDLRVELYEENGGH
ncbi:MAG TPA: hypothetical protein PK228_07705 [Saprospiraceae bacterium]|nr:hypothetical protein [Saprospiraceae bacterium]